MTDTSEIFRLWRLSLPFDEISLGIGGIRLAKVDEITAFQVGYSISAAGASFSTGQSGDWKPHWLAIGYDTCLGGPIVLDTSATPPQVLTAMHGAGEWDAIEIATSLAGFEVALVEVKQLSNGRENPVALEENPIPPTERVAALSKIEAANPGIDMQFWELQLGSGDE